MEVLEFSAWKALGKTAAVSVEVDAVVVGV